MNYIFNHHLSIEKHLFIKNVFFVMKEICLPIFFKHSDICETISLFILDRLPLCLNSNSIFSLLYKRFSRSWTRHSRTSNWKSCFTSNEKIFLWCHSWAGLFQKASLRHVCHAEEKRVSSCHVWICSAFVQNDTSQRDLMKPWSFALEGGTRMFGGDTEG